LGAIFTKISVVMVTHAQSLPVKARLRAKHALFLVLGLMTLFVLYHDERFLIHHNSDTWKFFYPVRGKLFVHALGGAIALGVGALQFSTRLRQRFPALHRLLGRFYLAGVSIAGPVAVYLSITHGIAKIATETAVQASVWVMTALMAFVAARRGNFEVHRQWMMRSYSITMIFVVSRIILALPVIAPTTDLGAERLGWILIICSLLVPQLIINWPQLFARPRAIRAGTSLESVRDTSRRRN
jgi:uncharacterized membrane protein